MVVYDEDHTINQCKNIFIVETRVSELKEQVQELKKEIASLRQELAKKGEEVKDVFYVADMTRARVDEVNEQLNSGLDKLTEAVKKYKTEVEAKSELVNHLREEIILIKEKAPKIFFVVLKVVAIVFAIVLLLFPKFHQILELLSK